jgi:hypothetical protein
MELKICSKCKIEKEVCNFYILNKTTEFLGCNVLELKNHLEFQFKEGMSWNNHGLFGWHIDHIKPLSSAKTEKELYILCHYTNLQPLWAKDNLSKGNKIL